MMKNRFTVIKYSVLFGSLILIISPSFSQNQDPIDLSIGLINVPLGARMESADLNGNGQNELILNTTIGMSYFTVEDYIENTWTPTAIGSSSTSNIGYLNMEVGDFDQDGDIDVCYAADSKLKILLNDGNAVFNEIEFEIPVSGNVMRDMGHGDLDGDGDVDFALALDATALWIENINNWSATENHIFPFSGVQYRGATVMDWDFDGDLDIVGQSGASAFSNVLFRNNNNISWEDEFIVGTYGGVHGFDTLDVDNDGDLDIGIATTEGLLLYDMGTGETQLSPLSFTFQKGGQFIDILGDGNIKWLQTIYNSGELYFADIDDNGQLGPLTYSGITEAYSDDMILMDGDGDGEKDLFISYYYGGNTIISVIPSFFLCEEPNGINEIEGMKIEPYFYNDRLEFRSSDQTIIESVEVFAVNGKLVLDAKNVSTSSSIKINGDIKSGIYLIRTFSDDNIQTRKLWYGLN